MDGATLGAALALAKSIPGTAVGDAVAAANRAEAALAAAQTIRQDTLAALTAPMETEGSAVVCHPVRSSTLAVDITCDDPSVTSVTVQARGKNLLAPVTGMRGNYRFILGAAQDNDYPNLLRAGVTYTLSFDKPFTDRTYAYVQAGDQDSSRVGLLTAGAQSLSFECPADGLFHLYLYNQSAYVPQPFTAFQLEVGDAATDITPYVSGTDETVTLTNGQGHVAIPALDGQNTLTVSGGEMQVTGREDLLYTVSRMVGMRE